MHVQGQWKASRICVKAKCMRGREMAMYAMRHTHSLYVPYMRSPETHVQWRKCRELAVRNASLVTLASCAMYIRTESSNVVSSIATYGYLK